MSRVHGLNYVQEELRILERVLSKEGTPNWTPRKLAQGTLRTCSFIAFAHAYGPMSDDIHRMTASHMFDVPLDEVTKDQRAAAKVRNFRFLYGTGREVSLGEEDAVRALQQFYRVSRREGMSTEAAAKALKRFWKDDSSK